MAYAFIAAYAVNLVYAVIRLVHCLTNKGESDWQSRALKYAFMMLCPLVAPLYLSLAGMMQWGFLRRSEAFDAEKNKPPVDPVLVTPDEVTELNVVPLEEAMAVSHKTDLRRMLLALLKNDDSNAIGVVATALSSDDGEAAHYAASAVADALAGFHTRAHELELATADGDPAALAELIKYLLGFLAHNILPRKEARAYLTTAYQSVLMLLAQNAAMVQPYYLSDVNELAVRLKDEALAAQSAATCAEHFPDTLETYLTNLRACFALGDSDGFRSWLFALRSSQVVVNEQVMDIIRTFS